MKISLQRRTDLAIRALEELSTAEHIVAGSELADRIGTSPGFLAQVMTPLTRPGWVTSERGPGGGYRLVRSIGELTMLEVIEAVEGPTTDGMCVLRSGPCPGSGCPIHDLWTQARAVLTDGLDRVSVADTLAAGGTP